MVKPIFGTLLHENQLNRDCQPIMALFGLLFLLLLVWPLSDPFFPYAERS